MQRHQSRGTGTLSTNQEGCLLYDVTSRQRNVTSRQRNVIVIQPIINTELTPRSLAAEAGGGFWPICLAVDSGHSDTHPRIWRGFWWVRKPGIKMRKTGHACRVCAYAHIFINNSKTNKDRTLRLHMHEAMIYIY